MSKSSKEPSNITSTLREVRRFTPSSQFASAAHVSSLSGYGRLWQRSTEAPEIFWGEVAEKELSWFKKWSQVLAWDSPHAKWFVDGKINASYNCLDRHLRTWRRNKAAIIWEGEPGETKTLTYSALHREVCLFANGLKSLGLKPGDRASIYMPLIPEAVIAMLACARIGVTHSVIFGGFSADAIADRNNDAQSRIVITADGGYRKGASIPLKDNVDEALKKSHSIEKVVVYRRTGDKTNMIPGRDIWWHDLIQGVKAECPAEEMDSEHPLFILYTSGSTGKPKGILHTTGGYLVGCALSHKLVFDIKDDDTYWCTADVGWITGHSYLVYGPLTNGSTMFMYEGAPNTPDWGRFWSMIERHRITILYTAPTAIRSFARQGSEWPQKYDLSSLRLLGTVGEPINPETWMWYRDVIGGGRCPIVDTWWQTETGSIMIAPLPGATPTIPGSATLPFLGVVADVVDKDGKSVGPNQGGFLVIRKPWPSMLRTIHGDDARFREQYWNHIPGMYFTGDGARRDENGYFWILGRIDDVLNVSGHRLSTMEIESSLVSHPKVAESAVVGSPHEIKGEGIHCFVTLEKSVEPSETLKRELMDHVAQHIGALARPESIRFTDALPKTRSGKIMRRLLRDIASGRDTAGDTSTLEDLGVLAKLREDDEG
jgi:acetyl-CoA synthetase